MPAWSDAKEWDALLRGSTCPICVQGKPRGIVAELEGSYLTADERTRVSGYCCLVAKRHAVEIHDLSDDEGAALMRDLRLVSKIVQGITGAVKMNHEIHGNTLPHLHVHVIPRYVGDELEVSGRTLGALEGRPYDKGGFADFVAKLGMAIRMGGASTTAVP